MTDIETPTGGINRQVIPPTFATDGNLLEKMIRFCGYAIREWEEAK
jgi:hypothetical protein